MLLIISIIKDFIDRRSAPYILAEFASGVTGISFVVACWNTPLTDILSVFIIPLLMYSISWDQYALRNLKKSEYTDLTELENKQMHKYSKLFAIFMVLPSYIAGLYLSVQFLQN